MFVRSTKLEDQNKTVPNMVQLPTHHDQDSCALKIIWLNPFGLTKEEIAIEEEYNTLTAATRKGKGDVKKNNMIIYGMTHAFLTRHLSTRLLHRRSASKSLEMLY